VDDILMHFWAIPYAGRPQIIGLLSKPIAYTASTNPATSEQSATHCCVLSVLDASWIRILMHFRTVLYAGRPQMCGLLSKPIANTAFANPGFSGNRQACPSLLSVIYISRALPAPSLAPPRFSKKSEPAKHWHIAGFANLTH